MSAAPETADFPQADLIDRIAKALPPEVRTDYYREMMHCRSLPANDEMLRILYIMQILTFLIQQAPEIVVNERERLEQLAARFTDTLEQTIRSMEEYRTQFDQRLAELPEEISRRIQPEVIAKAIYESVRQDFARGGLLQLGQAFEGTFSGLERALTKLNRTTDGIEVAQKDAVQVVQDSSRTVVEAMHQSSETLIREGEHLSRQHRWPRDVLAFIVAIVVFMAGMRYARWLDSPIPTVERSIAPAPEHTLPVSVQPKQLVEKGTLR